MSRILVVEDSKIIGSLLTKRIESELNFETRLVQTHAGAVETLNEGNDFFLSLLDYTLPDAPDGEVIDYMVSKGIPVIVFTGKFDKNVRDTILSKPVVDYVLKDESQSIDYIISLIKRVNKNRSTRVLVVDDSIVSRHFTANLLKVHLYHVIEAVNGEEALKVLDENQGIKLVITDYNMAKMDGLQLVSAIRERYSKEELAIIGVSTSGNTLLSARFIKSGANDFLSKPFFSEEFYCRVTQNIGMVEQIEQLKKTEEEAVAANKLKDKFVSLVSHDLRSPFTSLLGYMELMLDDKENPLHEEHRTMMRRLVNTGRGLVDLIQGLLDISRLKTGKIKPRQEFIDAHFLIDKSITDYSLWHIRKGSG